MFNLREGAGERVALSNRGAPHGEIKERNRRYQLEKINSSPGRQADFRLARSPNIPVLARDKMTYDFLLRGSMDREILQNISYQLFKEGSPEKT